MRFTQLSLPSDAGHTVPRGLGLGDLRAGSQKSGEPRDRRAVPLRFRLSGSYVVESSFYKAGSAVAEVAVADAVSVTSRNVYGVGGQRVMRVDGDGSKTLYLGNTEVRWDASGEVLSAARFYPYGVVRGHDAVLVYTTGNHQGSVTSSVDAGSGVVSVSLYSPFGVLRSGQGAVGKAFLGETIDVGQGLNYLNNRHYDPSTGVFTSVDPLVTMTGQPYIYGAANPVTFSDPSGLCPFISGECHFGDGSRCNPTSADARPIRDVAPTTSAQFP